MRSLAAVAVGFSLFAATLAAQVPGAASAVVQTRAVPHGTMTFTWFESTRSSYAAH